MSFSKISHSLDETGLEIAYDDDEDKLKAGLGLESFPLINQALENNGLQYWEMSPSERVALIFLLEYLKPKVAIEIGTRHGGSLQVISHFSGRVYSLDIDPEVPARLKGQFHNVEYLIGPSRQTLPPLLQILQRDHADVGFVLVDGDHSSDGVRNDIDNILQFRPTSPLYIVMHDSFNPGCRLGLRQAKWAANPFVHAVELDFVAGLVQPTPAFRNQLWGGLAMAILLPYERRGRFEITARAELTVQGLTAPGRRTLQNAWAWLCAGLSWRFKKFSHLLSRWQMLER
jgi:hypothetical protein